MRIADTQPADIDPVFRELDADTAPRPGDIVGGKAIPVPAAAVQYPQVKGTALTHSFAPTMEQHGGIEVTSYNNSIMSGSSGTGSDALPVGAGAYAAAASGASDRSTIQPITGPTILDKRQRVIAEETAKVRGSTRDCLH